MIPEVIFGMPANVVFNQTVYKLVEIVVYILLFICVRDSLRKGRVLTTEQSAGGWAAPNYSGLFMMLSAMIFTFSFEYLLTHKEDAIYAYKMDAIIELGAKTTASGAVIPGSAVPLWIPCGWAFIMYVVMQTTDKLELVWYKRPVADALMALMIDFALDPIAVLNQWWVWDLEKLRQLEPEKVENMTRFFGIPATNFMAWIVIVGTFSFFVRLGHRKLIAPGTKGWWGDALVPALAAIPSIGLVIVYTLIARWFMAKPELWANGALLCSVIWAALFLWVIKDAGRMRTDHPKDDAVVDSARRFLIVLVIALYTTHTADRVPLYVDTPELAIFVPVCAVLGGIFFAWPYLEGRRPKDWKRRDEAAGK